MLAKRIIPCLDVESGRVVKGIHFVDLRDAGDPVELAAFYDREGADELVFLDITASHEGRDTLVELAGRTGDEVFIPYTIGGGISTLEDIRNILKAGADKVSVNTSAVNDPELITRAAERFGSQCVVVAIDGRVGETAPGRSTPTAGRTPTGVDVVEWARKVEALGAGEIMLTSMDRDGTRLGYDIPMTRAVCEAVSIPVIASGGAGSLEHLAEAVEETGCDAVLAASIFHYGEHTIAEAKASWPRGELRYGSSEAVRPGFLGAILFLSTAMPYSINDLSGVLDFDGIGEVEMLFRAKKPAGIIISLHLYRLGRGAAAAGLWKQQQGRGTSR